MSPQFFFGPEDELRDALADAAASFHGGRARVAVAWAVDEGAATFLDALGDHISTLEVVVGVNHRGTTVEALLRLLDHSSSLGVLYKHPRQTFHPKACVFDGGDSSQVPARMIVGSSNMTIGGLESNFEASLAVDFAERASGEARAAIDRWNDAWRRLLESPFYHHIATPDDVRGLYDAGLVFPERVLRAVRRREEKRAKTDVAPTPAARPTTAFPIAPPKRRPRPARAPIEIPFPTGPGPTTEGEPTDDTADPAGAPPLAGRFFVRTLTVNDVAKLQGNQVGTFEPDLGQMARDRFPAFWGWPDEYENVVHTLPRLQWEADARLLSSQTPPEGVPINVVLWFRPERPGHAAEHRLRPGPKGAFQSATPPSFDETSLLVVQRDLGPSSNTFVLRLITRDDEDYDDFASYLTEERPAHRFGYGP